MKLSWKLFFITTPIFILFLTVFGVWIIQDNFQTGLDQEIEQCIVENEMLQNSYELTWNSLSAEQKEQTSMRRLVESFYRKSEKETSVRILDESGSVLYQDGENGITHDIRSQLTEEENVGYGIFKNGDSTYAVVLGSTSFGNYIETTRDITDIFTQRTNMYSRYQVGVLILTVLVGGMILLVLFFVMRNMQKLSAATRQFARGQYDVRVNIKSSDEIGMLADDFNWMANEMNQQMQRLKGEVKRQEEFTAAFAHELKTPLTSIIGYADTIRGMELSKEETDMCADYIFRQGRRLQSLSYKLLEMTMAEKQELERRRIVVPEFLEEIEKTAAESMTKQGMTLRIQAQYGMIFGDRELLGSVFLNLIDNARKASADGQIIELSGMNIPGSYLIEVRDHGKGIPKEELSRITEAFYMVDKSRSRKEGGAGLGLALCRKILELHEASWRIESEPGEGTKVSVLFAVPQSTGRKWRAERKVRRSNERKQGNTAERTGNTIVQTGNAAAAGYLKERQ